MNMPTSTIPTEATTIQATDKLTKRADFIAQRITELRSIGYSAIAAERRAAKDWRLQSPQHKAAVARRVALADERLQATGDVAGYRI